MKFTTTRRNNCYRCTVLALFALLVAFAADARAALVQYTFSGFVSGWTDWNHNQQFSSFAGISLGDHFSGNFRFDNSVPATSSDSYYQQYNQVAPPFDLSVDIGSLHFDSPTTGGGWVSVFNDTSTPGFQVGGWGVDMPPGYSTGVGSQILLNLSETVPGSFPTTNLLLIPNLSFSSSQPGVDYASYFNINLPSGLSYPGGSTSDYMALGMIMESLSPVPEPSSLVLAGFGIIGLLLAAARRRWRATN